MMMIMMHIITYLIRLVGF